MQGQWFESWFDSPWYPILYSHRDHAEAEEFISNLLKELSPVSGARFLDLACGRGRHSRFIHQQGYDVTGLDLSAASIADAQQHAAPGLHFAVHDMRRPFLGRFDYILNLFTSFGYFANKDEDLQVLRNVADSLNPDGTFVLDFFNLEKVLKEMVTAQEIEKQGIHFSIRKRFENGVIVKTIDFSDQGQARHFEERVQGLDLRDFQGLLLKAGLKIHRIWGDYQGNEYDPELSPRLILFAGHSTTPSAS